MKQYKAKVLDIQIPKQYINDQLVDIIERDKILFKISSPEGIENIEVKQNKYNTRIHIDDEVLITKQTISNIEYTDIETTNKSNIELAWLIDVAKLSF